MQLHASLLALSLAASTSQATPQAYELGHVDTLLPSVGDVTNFGWMLDVDEDGDRLAVFAFDASGSPNDWSVFIFEKRGTTWTETQQLFPPVTPTDYPRDMAISGNHLAVGVEGFPAAGLGEVFVFEADLGGAWSWNTTLDAPGVKAVAVSGDRVMASGGGGVRVFRPDGSQPSGWLEEPLLVLPPGLDTGFAQDLDASSTRLIGGGSTMAHVFTRTTGGAQSWTYTQSLPIASLSRSGGVAVEDDVAVVGDINLFGVDGFQRPGAAHVYEEDAGGSGAWGSTATAVPKKTSVDFGIVVDINNNSMAVADTSSGQIGPQFHLYERIKKPGSDAWRLIGFIADGCHPPWDLRLAGKSLLVGVDPFSMGLGAVYVYRKLDLSSFP